MGCGGSKPAEVRLDDNGRWSTQRDFHTLYGIEGEARWVTAPKDKVYKLGRDGKPHMADWFYVDNLHQGGRPWTYNAGGYKQGWTGCPDCKKNGKVVKDKSGVTRINPYRYDQLLHQQRNNNQNNNNNPAPQANTTVVNVQQAPQPQVMQQPQVMVQQAAPQPQMMVQQQQPQMMVQQQQPQMMVQQQQPQMTVQQQQPQMVYGQQPAPQMVGGAPPMASAPGML